jgi:hypothetical protein
MKIYDIIVKNLIDNKFPEKEQKIILETINNLDR